MFRPDQIYVTHIHFVGIEYDMFQRDYKFISLYDADDADRESVLELLRLAPQIEDILEARRKGTFDEIYGDVKEGTQIGRAHV